MYYRVNYGIKEFNSDGSERSGCDVCTDGAHYVDIESAIDNCKGWFDSVCNGMNAYHWIRRKNMMAFAYLTVESDIDADDHDDAFMKLDAETKAKVNAASFEMHGRDIDSTDKYFME